MEIGKWEWMDGMEGFMVGHRWAMVVEGKQKQGYYCQQGQVGTGCLCRLTCRGLKWTFL